MKTADGELTYGSMAEVRALYQQGFITAEDEIRSETSSKWVKCGSLRVLAEAETRGKRETAMGLRVALGIAFSVVLAGVVEKERWVFFTGLVFLAALVPFFVYRKR